ncbi:hypothetical protein DIPPA_20237 [Diplonema papillatum]|nr:hypothetical protein DIPPA_20237 [Diplonema papillatum]
MSALAVLLGASLANQPMSTSIEFYTERTLDYSGQTVLQARFSLDGWSIAVVTQDGSAFVHDLALQTHHKLESLGGAIQDAFINNDGTAWGFNACSDRECDVYWYTISHGTKHRGQLNGVEFTTAVMTTDLIVACDASNGTVFTTGVHTTGSSPAVDELGCASLAVSGNGQVLAVANNDAVDILAYVPGNGPSAWSPLLNIDGFSGGELHVMLSDNGSLLSVSDGDQVFIHMLDEKIEKVTSVQQFTITPGLNVPVAQGAGGRYGTNAWEFIAYLVDGNVHVLTLNETRIPPNITMVNDWTFETTSHDVEMPPHGNRIALVNKESVDIFDGCIADMTLKKYNVPSNGYRQVENSTQEDCHRHCCGDEQCTMFQWLSHLPSGNYPQKMCLLFEDDSDTIVENYQQPFHTFIVRKLAVRNTVKVDDDDGFPVANVVLAALFVALLIFSCVVVAHVLMKKRKVGSPFADAERNNHKEEIRMTMLNEAEVAGADSP